MTKFQITRAASFLYDLGARYHSFGTLAYGKVKVFDYYQLGHRLSDEQKAAILEWCPDARFTQMGPLYAPEIRHSSVLFPKAGFYRLGREKVNSLVIA